MRGVRYVLILCAAVALIAAPSAAGAEDFEDYDGYWVMGERVQMTGGCWGDRAVGKYAPRVQVLRKGKWVSIAKGSMVNDAQECSDDRFPLLAQFSFVVQDLGRDDPDSRGNWLTVRVGNGLSNDRYPIKVYASRAEVTQEFVDDTCYDAYEIEFNDEAKAECRQILGDAWKPWYESNVGDW